MSSFAKSQSACVVVRDKSRRQETRCRALVDNEILRKSGLHQSEICKGQFYTCNSSKLTITSSSSSVSSRESIITAETRFFFRENT